MTVGIFLEDGVEARICAEIAARQKRGIAKYGMTVAENPLSLLQWLQHATEECAHAPLVHAPCLRRAGL